MQQNQTITRQNAVQELPGQLLGEQLIEYFAQTPRRTALAHIAARLSKIDLFNDQAGTFYSVAQHRVMVAALCGHHLPKEAMLAGVADYFLESSVSTSKCRLGAAYANIQANFEAVISAKFDISLTAYIKEKIRDCEAQAYNLEHRAIVLSDPKPLWGVMERLSMVRPQTVSWTPQMAQLIFLTAYGQYSH